jgi:hypothetical protein
VFHQFALCERFQVIPGSRTVGRAFDRAVEVSAIYSQLARAI